MPVIFQFIRESINVINACCREGLHSCVIGENMIDGMYCTVVRLIAKEQRRVEAVFQTQRQLSLFFAARLILFVHRI